LGPIPNPQSPIPNPQSPYYAHKIFNKNIMNIKIKIIINNNLTKLKK